MTAVAAATAAPLVPKWYSAPPCPGCIPLPDLGWNSIKSPWKEKKDRRESRKKKEENFVFLALDHTRQGMREEESIDARDSFKKRRKEEKKDWTG